jgi:hypothetical protein
MDKTRIEDAELSDIRELFDLWLDFELGFDPLLTSDIIKVACQSPQGFNEPVFEQFLRRVAGEKGGGVSAKRLGEWLRRISGRVVRRAADDRMYRLIRGQASSGRASFQLSEVTSRTT